MARDEKNMEMWQVREKRMLENSGPLGTNIAQKRDAELAARNEYYTARRTEGMTPDEAYDATRAALGAGLKRFDLPAWDEE